MQTSEEKGPSVRAGVHLRNLQESDRPALAAYWLGLSAQERRQRFNWSVTDDALERYTHAMDFSQSKVIGAFDAGTLKGVAEIIPCKEGSSADVAIVLSKDLKGKKVADTMLDILRHQARAMGIDTLQAHMEPSNQPMMRLAKRSGYVLQYDCFDLVGKSSLACAHPH